MDLRLTAEETKRVLDIKRDLHMHPELSHKEFETTKKIRAELERIGGFEILELPDTSVVKTGVVARLRGAMGDPAYAKLSGLQEHYHAGGQATAACEELPEAGDDQSHGEEYRTDCGPEVGLRADIDALPLNELYDSPWKSTISGRMHGCGHDFHTASLLGAAMILARNREAFPGTVDFLFQEAEETTNGCKEMIDAGLLNIIHPRYFFAMHNRPEVSAGKIVIQEGSLMSAKSNFAIYIHGKGGHGAMPHLCIDPIVCASTVIMSLQTIVSRNIDPMDHAILTIGSVHGGSIENLIVDEVAMTGCVRSLSQDAKNLEIRRLESIVMNTAAAYECTARIEYREELPAVFNSHYMTEIARKAASAVVGEVNCVTAVPTLASEDFAVMMEKVPSYLYWVGSGTEGEPLYAWHNQMFHTNDKALKIAAELYASSAVTANTICSS